MPQSLVITAIQDETDRIRVFSLAAADGSVLPAYSAGAHLTFDLGTLGTRSYSLIDWPGEAAPDRYTIAVQREDGGDGGSCKMHALAVGDELVAEGPKNDFELRAHDGPALLLAGGIGITPLISMATALQTTGRAFRLVYAGRSQPVMGFYDKIHTTFPDAEFYFDDTRPLDLDALMRTLSPGTHLYLCGPRGLIDAARNAAVGAALPEDQIHIELFTTPAATAAERAFEVEIHDTGDVYEIPPGRSIIEVLEENGMDLMYDCQRGDCGICQTDVIDGVPDHRDVVLSEEEKASGKVMQICVSRAKSPRLVLDL